MKNSTTFLGAAVLLLTVTLCPAQSTQTFTFQGNVFQTYVVPTAGWYLIDAKGAQGGFASSLSYQDGLGAHMQGHVKLQAGGALGLAVGGQGGIGTNAVSGSGANIAGGGLF